MRCAVVDHHARAEHLVSDERALFARGVEAAAAGMQELFGDAAAGDLLLEVVPVDRRHRLNPANHAREVARPAGLLLQQVVKLDALGDGLAVGDLRLTCLAFDAVLAPHALNVDVQVQLAHAGDDGFLALGIIAYPEGRILPLEPVHRLREVGAVFLVLVLD